MPRIYESKTGTFHRTRADAGKGYIEHNITPDKDTIIATLTDVAQRAGNARPAEPPIDTRTIESPIEAPPAAAPADPGAGRFGADTFAAARAKDLATLLGVDVTTVAITERIEEMDGPDLGRVVLAAAERLKELAR